jgi:hypothetical protein
MSGARRNDIGLRSHLLPRDVKIKILWHVDLLRGNDRGINKCTTAATEERLCKQARNSFLSAVRAGIYFFRIRGSGMPVCAKDGHNSNFSMEVRVNWKTR